MAFTTIPAAGAKLRGSTVSALFTEIRAISAVKTGDTSRNTTVARVADPDLTIAVPANSTWQFTVMLILSSAANAAGDFSGEFSCPTGSTIMWGSHVLVDSLASGQSADLSADSNVRQAGPTSTDFSAGCSTTITGHVITGRLEVGSTSGSLTLNWAQLASNGNNTTVNDGSFIWALRTG